MAHKDLEFSMLHAPAYLPVYLRTNYTFADETRALIKIKMPLMFDDTSYYHPQKIEQFAPACKKWFLKIIVNRHFDHEESSPVTMAKINNLTNVKKCVEWAVSPSTSEGGMVIKSSISDQHTS
jgi:hypothetical protein